MKTKAMTTPLVVAVAAIVILVTALVVLAIFLNVIPLVVGLTEAKAICQTRASVACGSMNQWPPPTWNVQNIQVDEDGDIKTMSCGQIMDKFSLSCGCKDKVFECTGGTTGPDAPYNPPT